MPLHHPRQVVWTCQGSRREAERPRRAPLDSPKLQPALPPHPNGLTRTLPSTETLTPPPILRSVQVMVTEAGSGPGLGLGVMDGHT